MCTDGITRTQPPVTLVVNVEHNPLSEDGVVFADDALGGGLYVDTQHRYFDAFDILVNQYEPHDDIYDLNYWQEGGIENFNSFEFSELMTIYRWEDVGANQSTYSPKGSFDIAYRYLSRGLYGTFYRDKGWAGKYYARDKNVEQGTDCNYTVEFYGYKVLRFPGD